MRVGVGRAVAEIGRIEDRDVGAIAFLQQPAVLELERARGRAGHLVDRELQRQRAALAHVMVDDAREGAVEARMRHALADGAVRRDAIAVGADQRHAASATMCAMSSSEIEVTSTRVAPWSSVR